MPGNSFGHAFRVTTAGESHGPGNVVIIDGCPPGIALSVQDLQHDLDRRKPGQSKIVTQRKEPDLPEILSGVFEGRTTGTSIAILVRNADQKSRDYANIKDLYRPGHADFTFDAKYGVRDFRGGGRSSARETVARVAAGVVAKKILASFGARVVGHVFQVGQVRASLPEGEITEQQVERLPDGKPNVVRCADPVAAAEMIALIERVRKEQDSIGGIAQIEAYGVPAGLGEPVFDKLKADLGKALLSLPAVLGVEYGIGFACATLRGSENNDAFVPRTAVPRTVVPRAVVAGQNANRSGASELPGAYVTTSSNRHGGTLGGISSGAPIVFRAAVKPTSSIPKVQETVNRMGEAAEISTRGRHDPCLLPRFIPMAEAMVALVLADHWLRQQAFAAESKRVWQRRDDNDALDSSGQQRQ